MGGGGDGTCTEKNFGPIPHQTICESDPSNGLEIMWCSNKVPESGTRGRADSSYSSIEIYIYSYMDHTLATGTGQFPQTYKHLALSLPAE